MPLWLALAVIVGIVIGSFYGLQSSGNRLSITIKAGANKLSNLLSGIDKQYVDSVDVDQLVEKAIPLILSELDPHSVYISTEDVELAEDDLRGSFYGVGIEFIIRNDTLRVQNVISGGPAEQAGLLAGDKIVTVDDSVFTGESLTNEVAMHTLKGPQGTQVRLGVVRGLEGRKHEFTVIRDKIETHSVTAAYMLDEATGYVKIKNFGENTYEELIIALAQLSMEGFNRLVVDLRGNTGGYLQSAVNIAQQFLPRNSLIVYTEGLHYPRDEYRSSGRGSYVYIDEGSASASEILAGAIQDNDRGTIIGRRSFGKGLVQQPIPFTDGSLMRLTIARYYTPSGRCIQKPYTSCAISMASSSRRTASSIQDQSITPASAAPSMAEEASPLISSSLRTPPTTPSTTVRQPLADSSCSSATTIPTRTARSSLSSTTSSRWPSTSSVRISSRSLPSMPTTTACVVATS